MLLKRLFKLRCPGTKAFIIGSDSARKETFNCLTMLQLHRNRNTKTRNQITTSSECWS